MKAVPVYVGSLAWAVLSLLCQQAIAANSLTITSPATGTVVAPGQVLTVNVSASGTYPNGIAIVGGSPLITSQGTQTGSNPTFSITIPPNAPAGAFGLSAMGSVSTGALVQSAEVTLDVERPDAPQTLAVQPAEAHLNYVGDSLSLNAAMGTYADGGRFDLRRSSSLQASSSNPNVVIFQGGWLIAAGPGSATVTFTVGTATAQVKVTVPNSAPGDLNADGRIDNTDVAILQSALNTPAAIANDARDLNQDGQITSADVTLLKTLCTNQKSLCATH